MSAGGVEGADRAKEINRPWENHPYDGVKKNLAERFPNNEHPPGGGFFSRYARR